MLDLPKPRLYFAISKPKAAFTLVELLVVIAIIGILIGLLLPAVQAAREAARRTQCANNQRQIGLALLCYLDAKKTFPPGMQQGCYKCEPWAWSALILPFMEESKLYDRFVLPNQPDHIPNALADYSGPTQTVISTFLCPSTTRIDISRGDNYRINDFNQNGRWDPGEGLGVSDYAGIRGPDSNTINPLTTIAYDKNHGVLLGFASSTSTTPAVQVSATIATKQISDGLSKTIIVAEVTGRGYDTDQVELRGTWADGYNILAVNGNINRDPNHAWGHGGNSGNDIFCDHPAGTNALFCDGSVHYLSDVTDIKIVAALASRDGGEPIPAAILGN